MKKQVCGKQQEKIDLCLIQTQLIPEFDVPEPLLTIQASLKEGCIELYQQEAMQLIKQLLNKVDEELIARSLS